MSVTYYDNVLEPSYCKYLFEDSLYHYTSDSMIWTTNHFWPDDIKCDSTVLIRNFDEATKEKILWNLKNQKIIDNNQYGVMNYVWTKYSYIPWHVDMKYKSAITIYLNPVWDDNWGGVYLHKEPNTNAVSGFIPKFNTALKNSSYIEHCTTPVNSNAQVPRITIQLFPI